ANGVQIVKTAAALARAGCETTLVVRDSDPRPTPEILSLYAIEAPPQLRIKRLSVGHRSGAFALPRLRFLAQATALSLREMSHGALVFTRDLQLADALLVMKASARVVYEAHAVEALMYRERPAIYGTTERVREGKAKRLARREARVWTRAVGFVTTT